MRLVGPAQYQRLLAAIEYYEKCGFKYVNVPWAVSKEAILMTRPPHVVGDPLHYIAGGIELYPVASAEQSFLQMQLDATDRISGSFCTITPCFRNEDRLDDLHQPYFEKVELIS